MPEKTTTPTMGKLNKEEIKTWQDHTATKQVDIIVHLNKKVIKIEDNNFNTNKLKLDHKIHNINNQDKLIKWSVKKFHLFTNLLSKLP